MKNGLRRLAMWSGPRNISTALLRSWGNRPDTFVCDEPFYAHYLLETGTAHPGADEVIRHYETDPAKVSAWLTGPIPEGKTIFFQKHMAHHLLPDIDRAWMNRVDNAFLIREPREMLTSLVRVFPKSRLPDTGLPQQVEIFQMIRRQTGRVPPVLDARDVLDNPRRVLGLLCETLDIGFSEAMLSWPPGPRATDGIWAKYWYDAVVKTTSFQAYQPKNEPVPDHLTDLLEQTESLYRQLHAFRLGQ